MLKGQTLIYSEFKTLVLSKTQNRKSIPNDAQIDYKVWTALKKVAKETIALQLVVNDPLYSSILRKIDDNTYIRIPNRPISDADTIDIDDVLLDAAALHVAADIEKPNANTFMGMFWNEIEDNNSRLIETSLAVGEEEGSYSDASCRFA